LKCGKSRYVKDANDDGETVTTKVNQVLGNHLRLHYPGLVIKGGGHSEPATTWRDYTRAPDVRYGNAQGVMRHTFWVSLYMFITSVTSCIHNFCTNRRLFDIIETFSCE
jgi:hypothetical protein